MEKLLLSELFRYVAIMGASVIVMAVLWGNLISRIKGNFKPYRKAAIVYTIVAILCFALAGLLAYPFFFESPVILILALQSYFLVIGILHAHYLYTTQDWPDGSETLGAEFLFTLFLSILGAIPFLIVFHMVNRNGFQYLMAGSILFFMIPWLFYLTFRKALAIPVKILYQWYYPVNAELEEPEDSKLKNLLVISFEFQKRASDSHLTNFRAKAPLDMDFGELFYYFINDYNERHKDSRIQYLSAEGNPDGWIFYKRPRWYTIYTKYLDAEKTIFSNRIRENDVIICSRIKP